MARRFATILLSVLMLAVMTSATGSAPRAVSAAPAVGASPAGRVAIDIQPTETTAGATAPGCILCVLATIAQHALLLDNGANLRVDGAIVVNQPNWYQGASAFNNCGQSPCTAQSCHPPFTFTIVMVCGDAVDLFQSGGNTHTALSAGTISIAGGWETHGGNVMKADGLPTGCAYHPEPPAYDGFVVANVCIGTDPIVDPLDDPADPAHRVAPPDRPVASANCAAEPGSTLILPTGTAASPARLSIQGITRLYTICPGVYYGGFSLAGDTGSQPRVIMLPGTYDMAGGGFRVVGTASISSVSSQGDGVTIYNSSGPGPSPAAVADNVDLSTVVGPVCAAVVAPCGQIVLHAPSSGPYADLLIFQDRAIALGLRIQPALGARACTGTWMTDGVPPDIQPVPAPCGPLGGLSGTIYAPHKSSGGAADFDATVSINASGVANLRVIAAKINLLRSDTQARFTYTSPANLTGLGPAKVWIGVKNGDDVGTNFDLLAEVFENNAAIGSGELDNVPGGGSGFNRAVNRSIGLALAAPQDYGPSDKLSIKLSVRVATTGHRGGTARLWYNDAAANSLFAATINGSNTTFNLRDGFVLGTSPATVTSTSKKTIDVFVDRLVGNNPWKPFGTWTQ